MTAQTMAELHVWRADWHDDQLTISDIRRRVFIEEQRVPEALEWDGQDEAARHVLGSVADIAPCATGRLLGSGQIGRMAVLPDYRGQGLGSAILAELLTMATEIGLREVFLHAQVHALAFYERHGFMASGEPFEEAGLPHLTMTRELG